MVELALVLQVVVFATLLAVFVRSRQASVFHPLVFYFLFHSISFILRPTLIHFLGFHDIAWRIGYLPSDAEFTKTCLLTSFALVVVTSFALRFRVARLIPEPHGLEFNEDQVKAFWITATLILPLALYSMFLALGGFGWEGYAKIQVVRNLEHGKFLYTNTTGYFANAHTLVGYLAILFIVKNRFRWMSFLPFAAYLVYRGILGHGRWFIIVSVFTLILLELYRNRKTTFRAWHYVAGTVGFFIFNALGRNRNLIRDVFGIGSVRDTTPLIDGRTWFERLDNLDFSAFDVVAAVTNLVPQATHSYTYFTQYLQLFTQPIPRILWSGKPVGSPVKFFSLMDYGNFWRLPPSIVGDGWMSLGWAGVFITLAFVGFVLGRMHRWFWRNRQRCFAVVAYCSFLPLTIQWFRDGGISILVFAFFALAPVMLWHVIYKGIRWFRGKEPARTRQATRTNVTAEARVRSQRTA